MYKRQLKGSFRSVDGKNTYKVSGLKLRNVQGVRPGMLPLVAVDGRVGSITDLEKIPARKIETIQIFSSEDVFHNPALVKRYGDAARVGAILVTTRDAAKLAEKEARKSGAGESVVASVPEGPSFGTVQTGNTPVDGQVKVRISEVAVPNDSLVVSGHDLSSMLFLLDGRRVAVAEVKALNEAGIHAAFINSSLSESQISKALYLAAGGRYKIIYVAPERLENYEFLEFARQVEISMVTVDEAHCISQWGQDFRPSYLEIADFLARLPRRPVVSAFTATATERVKQDITGSLHLQNPVTVVTGFDRPNLFFRVVKRKGGKETDNSILNYVKRHEDESGIIYCATKKNVDSVCELLLQQGILAGR